MSHNEAQSIAGATACMAVAAKLEAMLQPNDTKQTTQEYFDRKDSAIAMLVAAAGPLPPRAAGALMALAEIIVGEIQDCGSYDFTVWRPEAMMSADERRSGRTEFAAFVTEADRPPTNVVQFRRA
ncbi:MAG: hypothetical protein HZC22_01455 [Rhodocyclales bacterium]|nr:hypothetical protein [Rhodocyclales bacterium]